MDRVSSFLFSPDFMPHGMCYLWRPEVLWLHVLSDGLIVFAYLSIPVALLYFLKRRKDLQFPWVFRLFAAFIFWCAMTHLMGMIVVWEPMYGVQGLVKLATAAVSVSTAIVLWPLIPKALALPSPAELSAANSRLEAEIEQRRRAEQELIVARQSLERRVQERTAELQATNDRLTEREHELQTLADSLTSVNQDLTRSNQELDDFAHIASHDLKEPLRGIGTYTDYLLEEHTAALDDEARDMLQTMQKLCVRSTDLINDLLRTSRLSRSDMTYDAVPFDNLVDDVLESLRIALDESNVEIRRPRRLPTLQCDPVLIREVFRNLISNAIKYNDKQAPWVEIDIASDAQGDTRTIVIRDNGIGIRERHLDNIFRIFKRLHGRDEYGGGTGAGLTIVKKIIERHEGRVWVESEFGNGSTFYFSLGEQIGAAA